MKPAASKKEAKEAINEVCMPLAQHLRGDLEPTIRQKVKR